MTSLPELGSVFAGYRLERYLARGGMGVVFEAEHVRLRRRVALKLLAPELAEDDEFRERFLKEAELAASLEHPSVVSVYDAGEQEGLLYLAMRYLPGGDLRELLQRQGRLSLERTLSICEQVAGALDAAHALGLVHRDVKPANILFDERRERAFLADFGVARRQSSKGLTRTGSFLGSVDYCAPEQIESALVDGRADVYALGGVCFHCLTGQPPYVRETEVAVLTAHLRDPPPALSRVRPDLPQALDGVLVTAMAKYPQVRYESAGEFARALREALSERAPASVPTGPAAGGLPETVRAHAPPTAASPAEPDTELLAPAGKTAVAPAARRSSKRVLLGVGTVALLAAASVGAFLLTQPGSDAGRAESVTTTARPLSARISPRMESIAARQNTVNNGLPTSEQISLRRVGDSADALRTAIVRAQGFLTGVANAHPRDPPVRKALNSALAAHLTYARALSNYVERPNGPARSAVVERAAAAEDAYARLERVAPALPDVDVRRRDHVALPLPKSPTRTVVRFASVDRLQHCEATAERVRCGSGPSGQVVEVRVGGPAVYLGRLGSRDRGGPALALGASIAAPGGAIRCDSSTRGITCADRSSGAAFVLGDYRHILANPGGPSGTSPDVGVPSTYVGYFTSVDRLQHCYATDSYIQCGSGPSGQAVELRAGVGATYRGVLGSRDRGGPSMPMGTSFRTPSGTIECASSTRGITCIDLAGSGESFTIGDHYVNVNGTVTRR